MEAGRISRTARRRRWRSSRAYDGRGRRSRRGRVLARVRRRDRRRGSYEAWAFGGDDTRELATELALLVRDGPKRATTGLLSEYEAQGEPLPRVGAYSVVLDGAGEPVCIIRTTRVDTTPFGEVDEEFTWVEGEGDRSLAYWREAHIRFFAGGGHPRHRR